MYLLSIFLGMACLWDYSSRRIPNFLQFNLMSVGLIYSFCKSGMSGVAAYFIKAIVMAGVLFIPYMLSMIGAGDVKMIALAAGFFRESQIVFFLFFSMLAALPPAIGKMLIDRKIRSRFAYFFEYVCECAKSKRVKPYHRSREEQLYTGIVMSGPVLFSVLLAIGGVY